MTTTWRKEIGEEMETHGDTWANIESWTFAVGELDEEFDEGYGGAEGKPFTIWTAERVYFPAVYDGAEWCASVARNPDRQPTNHIGGGI